MAHWWWEWARIVLILFAAIYVIGPIVIRFVQRMSADPDFQVIALQSIPQSALVYFSETYHQLAPAGFTVAAYLTQSNYIRGMVMHIMLVENSSGQDTGIAVVSTMKAGKAPEQKVSWTEFSSGFSDGSSLTINNSVKLGVFSIPPEKTIMQFPELRDASRLYMAFCRLIERQGKWGRISLIGKEPVSLMKSFMIKEMDSQVAAGYLQLTAKRDAYIPTWKGAILMTWKLTWPISLIRKMIQKSENKKILRELNIM